MGMPKNRDGRSRAAYVAPTTNDEFDSSRAIQPITTMLADQPATVAP